MNPKMIAKKQKKKKKYRTKKAFIEIGKIDNKIILLFFSMDFHVPFHDDYFICSHIVYLCACGCVCLYVLVTELGVYNFEQLIFINIDVFFFFSLDHLFIFTFGSFCSFFFYQHCYVLPLLLAFIGMSVSVNEN